MLLYNNKLEIDIHIKILKLQCYTIINNYVYKQ
jgi:hypothetical protein